MESEELVFNEYDEAEYYIKDGDDLDGVSLEDSGDSDVCAEDCEVCEELINDGDATEISQAERIGKIDQLKVIYSKKLVDSVNADFHEHQLRTQKTRDELGKCREKIRQLEKERDILYHKITQADEEGDMPNGDRLRAQHDRAVLELEIETSIEHTIRERLEQAEYDLAKAELDKGKYTLLEDDLKHQDEALHQQKLGDFSARQEQEGNYLAQSYKQIEREKTEAKIAARDTERRGRQAQADAVKAKDDINHLIQKTMNDVRTQKKDETARNSAELNRRISAVLSLKKNITINKDNINALRARNKDIQKQSEQTDKEYMKTITAQGGDAETALLVKKRKEQMEQMKVEHAVKQRVAETQIAAKLLVEEERFSKRRDKYPHLWAEKQWEEKQRVKPHKKRKLKTLQADVGSSSDYKEYIEKIDSLPKQEVAPVLSTTRGQYSDSDEEDTAKTKQGGKELSAANIPSRPTADTNYAQPEFEGMWNKFERYVVPKDVVVDVIKGSKVSTMEQNIMREKLEQQRQNIIQPQVAAGREFKGKSSFNSKPELVHFKRV